jgi:hypothetical protein
MKKFMRGTETDFKELDNILHNAPQNGDVKINDTYFWRFSVNPVNGWRQAEKFRYDRTGRGTSQSKAWAWV